MNFISNGNKGKLNISPEEMVVIGIVSIVAIIAIVIVVIIITPVLYKIIESFNSLVQTPGVIDLISEILPSLIN